IVMAILTSACPLNPRQKGFTCVLGCSKNLKLPQLLVKHCKREKCELGIVFVDIAKTFDTVSHQHIITGLRQRGVDPHVIHLVSEMYKNITTYID
ncbi:PO21 protein, partial [Leiothrix lutea]|nr:PO21 protein [Leiothrix lutea]